MNRAFRIKQSGLRALVASALLFAAPVRADVYFGLGAGFVFTEGVAAHAAASIYRGVEVYYSTWTNHETGRGFGAGYRLGNEGPLSVVLGAAYAPVITENLLRHELAYVEVRLALSRTFSCQASHYSGVGHDRGENLLLCGVHWDAGHDR